MGVGEKSGKKLKHTELSRSMGARLRASGAAEGGVTDFVLEVRRLSF